MATAGSTIFQAPMQKSVYDIDQNDIVDQAEVALPFIIDIQSGTWIEDPTTPAEHVDEDKTNIGRSVDWFDKTTEEFVMAQVQLPDTLDTSGLVQLKATGLAKTADGNEVQLCLYHKAIAKGEDFDAGAYSQLKSGDYVTDSDQDEHDEIEWSATAATLGWAAGDLVYIKLSRCNIDDGTTVNGDYGILSLNIQMVRT